MQIAHIAPVPALKRILSGRHSVPQMALVNYVLNDEEYLDFYRERKKQGDFVIMDNNAFEVRDRPTAFDEVIEAAELLQPHELVLPDVWGGSGVECVALAEEASELMRSNVFLSQTQFAAVPHGHQWEEYQWCVDQMVKIPRVTTIAVYEETLEDFGVHRVDVVRWIRKAHPHMQIHLLGCLEDLSDITDRFVRNNVRSLDTAKFVRWGFDLQLVTKNHIPPYPGRGGSEYFYWDPDPAQVGAARANIAYWDQLLKEF